MSLDHPVADDIRKLEALRNENRLWSVGSFVAIVVILVVGLIMVGNSAKSLFSHGAAQNQFASYLSNDLNSNVLPTVQDIAQKAITESQPADAAQLKQISQRLPELSGDVMSQFQTLQQDLPVRGQKVLSDSFGATLTSQQAKIESMYPDVTQQNVSAALDNLSAETQAQIDTTSQQLFAKHVSALKDIMADMRHIEATEPITADQNKANLEMAMSVVGAFHEDLANAAKAQPAQYAMAPAKEAK